MDPLTQYKESVKEQSENAELLIAKLIHENSVLTTKNDTYSQEVETLRLQMAKLQEQLKVSEELRKKQAENIEVIKDLFEHLCCVRVHKSYEDDTGLWFDTSQGSNNGVMDYKLGFVKGEESETCLLYTSRCV